MADDTNTAEREAAEQWLRDRYGAYRGHFAWRELEEAFLAGRASLAASAGSEPVATDMVAICSEDANRYCIILRLLGMEEEGDPVAEVQRLQDLAANLQGKQHGWLYDWTHSSATGRPDESFTGFTEDENHARSGTGNRNIRAVYTHPSPPEGMAGWISVDERLPEPGQTVAFVVDSENWATFKYLHGRVLGGSYLPGQGFSVPGLSLMASLWMPLPPAPPIPASEAKEL